MYVDHARELGSVAQAESIVSGLASRYAQSLFELALESGKLAETETDLGRFEALVHESDDLKRLIGSPVFTADEQVSAIAAIASKAGIGGLAGNFLKVVARNRRLFAIPNMIKGFRALLAEHRGEVSADVTSAHALSTAQMDELKATLKGVIGKDAAISLTVDPSILGGLVVRVGSRQIDSSLKTKLNSLKIALKEVG